jgi:subtilisin-like proprotein convertase family protein
MNPFRALLPLFIGAFVVQAQTGAQLEFKDHGPRSFQVHPHAASLKKEQWLKASPTHAPEDVYWIGSRIALQLKAGTEIQEFLKGSPLELVEVIDDGVFILQATDASTAANEADRLSKLPEVLVAMPIMREPIGPQSLPTATPNDPLFANQWNLENRDGNGTSLGPDLNIRAAWPISQGNGVTIGIADFAVETEHPDLASRSANSLHFNFFNNSSDLALADQDVHATALAGLCVGEMNNGVGISGVAPQAKFASWRIFNTNAASTDQLSLRKMFQYASNSVAVQNHSWAYTGTAQGGPTFVALQGIENAILKGRHGKGVVMVRSAGNFRLNSGSSTLVVQPNGYAGNANNDSYVNDPRSIAVAAVCSDGRVAHYSSPGACILVAAPSSESTLNDTSAVDGNFPTLTTTDRTGSIGYSSDDYATGGSGFTGTSGVTPQIAGLCALLLSANTNLTYRDIQQILILSSRHLDFSDPGVETNKAGLIVSHNLGFGIPDAAAAVKLAKRWVKRPALTKVTLQSSQTKDIPDAGYLVLAKGTNVPASLSAIPGWMPFEERHPDIAPGEMLRPDIDTAALPLVDLGQALNDITVDLSNKGALIQRGGDNFYNKVHRAEMAGARYAIVYNNAGDNLLRMTLDGFVRIPTIFVGQTAGTALANEAQTNTDLLVQVGLNKASYSFTVTNQLQCEHIGVRIQADTHARRGDMRIALISPNGTRSILQRYDNGFSTDTGPPDWTYWTTHHFFESSYGKWAVQFSDEQTNNICSIISCSLIVNGVRIIDKDHDGLDDNWEISKFGSIAINGPKDDPDHDGFINLREEIAGTNPNAADVPVLTTPPASRTIFLGSSTTFSVIATGLGPVLYQWRYEGGAIVGATKSSLTVTNADYSNAGNYSVTVDNITGSVTSSNATLRVILPNDLDENHLPELLVQSTNRFLGLWNMNSTNLASSFLLNDGLALSTNSRVVAQADFSGDGKPDLVVQSNGLISVWLMDGTNRTGVVNLKNGVLTPVAWKVVGTADFNHDKYPDLVLRHSAGYATVWQMKGTNFLSSAALNDGLIIPPDLKLVSLNDFNNDGNPDLLFQNTRNGNLTIWFMNGYRHVRTVNLNNRGMLPSQGWTISGAIDLSGDRKKDLVWQNTNGLFSTWFMNGTNVTEANHLFEAGPVPGWSMVGGR